MEKVLDALDLRDIASAALEVVDHLRSLRLATEPDDTASRIDVYLSLGYVRVTKELRLDLPGDGDVVQRLRLRRTSGPCFLDRAWLLRRCRFILGLRLRIGAQLTETIPDKLDRATGLAKA